MIEQTDLPAGVVSVLPGDAKVGRQLIGHPGVDKVSFTGSTTAGKAVAAACAADLKRVSLELGGKSAAVVLDDADPAAVATAVRSASLSNCGQICNALTRILLPANRSDEFVDALAAEMTSLRIGDPTDPVDTARPAGRQTTTGSRPRLHHRGSARRAPALSSAAQTCPTVSGGAGT